MLIENLSIAAKQAEEMKKKDEKLRFRFETCVHKDSIKMYVIRESRITKVITIDDGVIKSICHKNSL